MRQLFNVTDFMKSSKLALDIFRACTYNPQNGFGQVKKRPQLVLCLGIFLSTSFLSRMFPNVFEINEDKIHKINVVSEYHVFSCYVKEKYVGPVKN